LLLAQQPSPTPPVRSSEEWGIKDPHAQHSGIKLLDVSDNALALVRALRLVDSAKALAQQATNMPGPEGETAEEKEHRLGTSLYFKEKLNWEEFEYRVAKMYDSVFSAEELARTLEFAKSQAGQAFFQKSPAINMAANGLLEQMLVEDAGKIEMFIRDRKPLAADQAGLDRAKNALYEAQMLTETIGYMIEEGKLKAGDPTGFAVIDAHVPPEESVKARGGRDRLGNAFVFGPAGEPVRVNPESRRAFEVIVAPEFWGRYGGGQGEGGKEGVKPFAVAPAP
jgi:hypothetical protein